MDKLLYVAMSGAKEAMYLQNVQANNLANVDTVGFKADFAQARAMHVMGDGWDSRAYAMTERPGSHFESGALDYTGRDLDLAINGDGWFVVLDKNGEEAFTRAGNLFVDAQGFVTTHDGHVLMGNAGPLVLPEYEKLEIGVDGTITVRALGQGPDALVEVDRMKLVKPDASVLQKGEDGLFRRTDTAAYEPPDFTVRVSTGTLERSNVNAVGAMLSVMGAARQ
ncbi:MAG: flagellar basal body rod protein FlgF, partial [Gammaproteobacteria bacterium]